jgi:hypothetical protein
MAMSNIATNFSLASVRDVQRPSIQLRDSTLEHDGKLLMRGESEVLLITRDQESLLLSHNFDPIAEQESLNVFDDVIAVVWQSTETRLLGRIEQVTVYLDDSSKGLLVVNGHNFTTAGIVGIVYKSATSSLAIYTDFDCVQVMATTDFYEYMDRHYPNIRADVFAIPT